MWKVNMRTRDIRRHHRDRVIARVGNWLVTNGLADNPVEAHETAVKRFQHPQSCSQCCCGNPRKWFGEVTKQEVRASLRAKDEF